MNAENMNYSRSRETHANTIGASTLRTPTLFMKYFPALLAGFFIALLSFTSLPLLGAQDAHAESRRGYEAMQVMMSGGGNLEMAPGEVKSVSVQFLNKGPYSWTNDGDAYISIYTYDPRYRISTFEAADWDARSQPTRLTESTVAVGETGTIQFHLIAPSTTGVYEETFYLTAEETTFVPGGLFTFNITVTDEERGLTTTEPQTSEDITEEITTTESTESYEALTDGTASPLSNDGLSATVLLRSHRGTIKASAGEEIEYKVGIKNSGTVAWESREVKTYDLSVASVQSTNTVHSSWKSGSILLAKSDRTIKPGALDFYTFSFNAPTTKGSHTVRYKLAVNSTTIPDFYIDIPVDVTTGSASAVESELEDSVVQGDMIEEPIVRIGVLIVDEETSDQVVISCNSDWNLRDGMGNLLAAMDSGEEVTAFYKKDVYWYNAGDALKHTQYHLRFVPEEDTAICTIENFDRRATRNAGYPDNTFRDVLELRYNDHKDRAWIINELPMEEYLYGLAETSNISHEEYQKALVTVARTYATYHWERATKYKHEYFHMSSYSWDQVYNGEGHEERSPRIVEAVEDTRGITVTYDGATAITPYFSRSDGRTRDWSEVWGGSVPWCQSVEVPGDVGRTLWGHGVGLSATGALSMANDGSTFQEILSHFYQGIELNIHWE
jgi:hypothetical protein